MKLTKLFSAALAASTIAGSAVAADLPSRNAPIIAPVAVPVMTWTGFYVGINLGGAFGGDNALSIVGAPGPCNAAFPGCAAVPNYSVTSALGSTFNVVGNSSGGFLVGGQLGFNYQMGALVAGLETDIQGVFGGSNNSVGIASLTQNPNFVGFPVTTSGSASRKLDYLGTLRGRLGFLAAPSFLIYGTGGLAYGGVKARTSIWQAEGVGVDPNLPNGASLGTFSGARMGWTIGGGAEWKFAANWSLKAEYLYYDLGRASYSQMTSQICAPAACAVPGGVFASALQTTTVRTNGHIARAGLNYHFGGAAGPVVAKY